MNLLTICARGGSKGIPNKNLKIINGKPLIWYTLSFAKKLHDLMELDIVLSSDSEEILNSAKQFSIIKRHKRIPKLATDEVGKIDVLKDILDLQELQGKRYDYIIDLDVTSPIRTLEGVISAFEKLKSNDKALNIFSVSKASKNPYFNMVEPRLDGFVKISKSKQEVLSRQKAPEVFQLNASYYIYKSKFFELKKRSAITDQSLAYVVPHLCFDIDEEVDLLFLDFLLKEKIIKL